VFKDTLLDLLCEAMASTVRQGKGFLVTGFPKNVKQAQEYEAKVSALQERVESLGVRLQSPVTNAITQLLHYVEHNDRKLPILKE